MKYALSLTWIAEHWSVPDRVAKVITQRLHIPTIETGSGTGRDGQGLVAMDIFNRFMDMVG